VHEGLKDDADLYVEMDAADFAELLKGTLDVEGAADDGRIRIRGDASLFGNLVAVLEPASA
jgi:ubiquinone biosynthesis protein UbiJ